MERILSMILRRLVNKGVNAGIKAASKRGGSQEKPTAEQRAVDRQGQQSVRGVRQATKMLRKINKF